MNLLSLSRWSLLMPLALVALLGSAQTSLAKSSGDAPAATPADTCPIKTGEMLPSLDVLVADGTRVDLAVSITRKPTLLVFYRGGW